MTDLIVDKLVFKDVQLTATNDDQYFVFEDILYQVNVVKSEPGSFIILDFTKYIFRLCSVFPVIRKSINRSN